MALNKETCAKKSVDSSKLKANPKVCECQMLGVVMLMLCQQIEHNLPRLKELSNIAQGTDKKLSPKEVAL